MPDIPKCRLCPRHEYRVWFCNECRTVYGEHEPVCLNGDCYSRDIREGPPLPRRSEAAFDALIAEFKRLEVERKL